MVELNSIDIVGGGPAGLYVAQLLKRDRPETRVRVVEQNPRGATFGFGVVFSAKALDFLESDDPQSHAFITPHMERWDNMSLVHRGEEVVIDGIGFAAIGRLHLIDLLTELAENAGVEIEFARPLENTDRLHADLIIGADGLNSIVRRSAEPSFSPDISEFSNRFAWFGTSKPFHTLTQTFLKTDGGAMNAHHYRYAPLMSTFIVECTPESFVAHGFDSMDETQSAHACEQIFSNTLEGASLIVNHSQWRRFPKMWCHNWADSNRVLIGDSAHTAHFSVGSGTRLAIEDALALANALKQGNELSEALASYQHSRLPIARKLVDAANTSANWYESFEKKMNLAPIDFGFDYITRSGRVDMDRLRKSSPLFMEAYDARDLNV